MLKHNQVILNMSVSLHTVFSADALPAEGQVLREEPTVNKGKSLKFQEGARMPTASSKEGQNLYPLQTISRKSASKWRLILLKVCTSGVLKHSRNYNEFEDRYDCNAGLKTFTERAQVCWRQMVSAFLAIRITIIMILCT
jgi:hypothetical protein